MDAKGKEKKAKAQGAGKVEEAVTARQESIKKTVQAGQEIVEKATKVGQDTVDKIATAARAGKENAEMAARAGTDTLSTGYDRYLAVAREHLEKVLPEAVGRFDDMASFGKGTADAYFKAGDVAAKALETIGDDVVAYNRKLWDDSVTNTKALFDCKTFEDVIELQTTVARAQFKNFVSGSAKLGEFSMKTINQAMKPIGA